MPTVFDSEVMRKLAYDRAIEMWYKWNKYCEDTVEPSQIAINELKYWDEICSKIANWVF